MSQCSYLSNNPVSGQFAPVYNVGELMSQCSYLSNNPVSGQFVPVYTGGELMSQCSYLSINPVSGQFAPVYSGGEFKSQCTYLRNNPWSQMWWLRDNSPQHIVEEDLCRCALAPACQRNTHPKGSTRSNHHLLQQSKETNLVQSWQVTKEACNCPVIEASY